jgi:hypothetical protein
MSRRHILSLSAIAVLGLVVLPNIAMARHKSLKDSILGSWLVVSVSDKYDDGHTVNPWGSGMKGNFTFDNAGRFTQILIGEADQTMKSPDPRKPDAIALAYFGSYTVSDADKVISLHVDGATNSMRAGSDQKFTLTMKGDAMTLAGSQRTDQQGKFSPTLEVKRAK